MLAVGLLHVDLQVPECHEVAALPPQVNLLMIVSHGSSTQLMKTCIAGPSGAAGAADRHQLQR
jgi:hypothetical protein